MHHAKVSRTLQPEFCDCVYVLAHVGPVYTPFDNTFSLSVQIDKLSSIAMKEMKFFRPWTNHGYRRLGLGAGHLLAWTAKLECPRLGFLGA